MKNDWWFKFEHMVWLTDPDLNKCSLATQGFWLRCICMMRKSGASKLTGTALELSRSLGVFLDEFATCVDELKRTKTADVTLSHENVTLKSRRFHRELNKREGNKIRKQRERAKVLVTPESQDRVRSKSKELEEEKKEEGKRTPPDDLGMDFLILKTESVLNLKLTLDEKRAVTSSIPLQFTDDWIVFLKARSLKLKNASHTGIIQALGYALTDYKRDNKKAYEQLTKPEQRLPTLAEKLAEEERRRTEEPRNHPPQLVSGVQ